MPKMCMARPCAMTKQDLKSNRYGQMLKSNGMAIKWVDETFALKPNERAQESENPNYLAGLMGIERFEINISQSETDGRSLWWYNLILQVQEMRAIKYWINRFVYLPIDV
jgi:hypothetical protein